MGGGEICENVCGTIEWICPWIWSLYKAPFDPGSLENLKGRMKLLMLQPVAIHGLSCLFFHDQ